MQRRAPDVKRAETLLRLADRDWEGALTLIQHSSHLHEKIGFDLQQAVEKYLKTALIKHSIPFSRTYDLSALLELLGNNACFAVSDRDAAAILTTFAVEWRYEIDETPELTAGELLALAQPFRTVLRPEILDFVK